jgi:surface antigen
MLSGASFRPRALLATAALCTALVLIPALPTAATIVCESDECDAGAWAAARGETNEGSFWNMSPGHNCTNYVAWRLITAGVPQPRTHPGNATDWAFRAMLDSYEVNNTPAIGSVAHWDGGAAGYSADGHVAYVEKINDDGTILVSEDFWLGGSQVGPLTYRVVDPATVSNFIHYGESATGLREVLSTPVGWQVRGTRLDPQITALAALQVGSNAPAVYFVENGQLHAASATNGQWNVSDTAIRSGATALAAVAMRERPFVMTLDEGALVMNVDTPSGWQRMPTGVEITGDIAAVDLGGLFPTVFVSQNGSLYRVWGDDLGWHAELTGIETWGPIAASVPASGWPEVFSVEGGVLFRAWQDEDGWHEESTGIPATGSLSAAAVDGVTRLILSQDGELVSILSDGPSWTATPMGVAAGALHVAVDVGVADPMIVQIG